MSLKGSRPNFKVTHMVMKMHDSRVLSRPTVDPLDLPKAAEVLLQDLLLVEGRRDTSAVQNRTVSGRRAAEALRALRAHVPLHGRGGARHDVKVFSFRVVTRGTAGGAKGNYCKISLDLFTNC